MGFLRLLLILFIVAFLGPTSVQAQAASRQAGAILTQNAANDPADSTAQQPAGIPEDKPPFQDSARKTVYHTVYAHLYYLQDETYDAEKAAATLYAPRLSTAEKAKLAARLKTILDLRGIYIDLPNLPRDPSLHNGGTYVLSPLEERIQLQRYGDEWLYSAATLEAIPVLYDELNPFGLMEIINDLPEEMNNTLLGIKYWQWLLILFLGLLAVVIHRILTHILRRVVSTALDRFGRAKHFLDKNLVLKTVRPISIFLNLVVFELFVPVLQLPVETTQRITWVFAILTPLFAILALVRVVTLITQVMKRLAEKTESTMDDQVIPLLKTVLHSVVWILGVLVILSNLGYNVGSILAGLSIGALALALAAQDTLKNFFSSLMIFVDKPFQIGDWVTFDGQEGVVEEVGLRSSRVRTFYNSLIYVPNAVLTDGPVDNYGLRQFRRYATTLGLQYDTPASLIQAYIKGLEDIILAHPATRKDFFEIKFQGFGASSLDIMVYLFFDVPDWSAELRAKQDFNFAALKLAETLGVAFAFPTQTLHIENQPGQPSLSLSYDTDSASVREKVATLIASEAEAWHTSWAVAPIPPTKGGDMDG